MSNVISTSTGTGLVPGRFDNTPLLILLPRPPLLEIGQIPYYIERSGRELHEKNRVIIIPGMQLICTRAACTTMVCIYMYVR